MKIKQEIRNDALRKEAIKELSKMPHGYVTAKISLSLKKKFVKKITDLELDQTEWVNQQIKRFVESD